MKRKIVLKDQNGNVIKEGTITQRNTLHFEVQKKTRATVVQSKKYYKRSRDKRVKNQEIDHN